jgi:hypothetical protein
MESDWTIEDAEVFLREEESCYVPRWFVYDDNLTGPDQAGKESVPPGAPHPIDSLPKTRYF